MGTGDESTPAKPSKAPPSSAQEAPTIPTYPDWSSSMQAYYGVTGATPPPFFPSAVTSPSPHPYIWGTQHPMMPPYGTPVPYPAIYPPGGVYTHPNMASAPVASPPVTLELDGKGGDGKDGNSVKKPKGIAGNSSSAGGKTTDSARATSGSGNDGASQSGDSGSEGSSDANEENNQQYHSASKKGSSNQRLADGKPAAASDPATNLNIGMDLWNASSASGAAKMRPNLAPASSGLIPGGMIPDQWMQDERELKRQRRKQSNRESARRSRLRKQVECEELQARVETLSNENRSLRDELKRLSEECEKLSSENSAIKGELMGAGGSDGMGNLEENPTVEKHLGDLS
ncbi:hypothetical protein MLD38_031188 [Melastoma candidum]|uniref:Uncharacterized protein n=1 Tax=Melastoma candidum TaxID=119954 RepID=A0ACB9MNJ6_9MYRT|nr:hypothetical protein MLD38_031188 [Melastoma candidum]